MGATQQALVSYGSGFIGVLDGYTTGLVGAYSVGMRLLNSYNGSLIRVRRSSDSAESDIGFDGSGLLDVAALNTFIGGGNWYLRTIYDQSGNARDLPQTSAAAQPRGGIDGNGIPYGYAETGAGDTAIRMLLSGLSIATTGGNTSIASIASSPGYATGWMCAANAAGTQERQPWSPGASIITQNQSGAGTNATLSSTTAGNLYAVVHQTGASGNRITRGSTTAQTGTAAASAMTIGRLAAGYLSGGVTWKELAKFYGGAVWSDDIGDTAADALVEELRTLFQTS